MGSTFTSFSGQKVKGFMGKEYSVPIYLQFVPGYCVEAVHSQASLGYKGPSTITQFMLYLMCKAQQVKEDNNLLVKTIDIFPF